MKEEEALYLKLRHISYYRTIYPQFYDLTDLELFCKNCQQEVLMYFVPNTSGSILCLECYMRKRNPTEKNKKLYFAKYPFYLNLLLIRAHRSEKGDINREVTELCNGKFVGKIN